jgi:hypothetical protein
MPSLLDLSELPLEEEAEDEEKGKVDVLVWSFVVGDSLSPNEIL